MDTQYRIAFGILAAATLLVRTLFQIRSLRTTEKLQLESRLNIGLRTLGGLTGLMLLLIYLWKPKWIAWASLPIPDALRWSGTAFGATGVVGLIWVHRELGRNFSGTLEIQADQVLVTSGPYQWVRHPMYTTLFLIIFSFFLLSANWLIGIMWIGGFAAVITSRVAKEDAALESKFGGQYHAWAARTGAFFPRLQ